MQVESVLPLASYHFDGDGKCLRPLVILCWAKAINFILKETSPFVIRFLLNVPLDDIRINQNLFLFLILTIEK